MEVLTFCSVLASFGSQVATKVSKKQTKQPTPRFK